MPRSEDGRQILFSRDGSAAIQTEFNNAIQPIAEEFKSAQNTVDGLHEWWKGDTADAFVEKFADTKQKVNNELNSWLEENVADMKRIETAKYNHEGIQTQRIRGF